ncbi:MAG: cell wall hydrolase [Pseudomonadota bacterium]
MLPTSFARAGAIFIVLAAVLGIGSSFAAADTDTTQAVERLLAQERKQLIALGANRAKRIAGVNDNILTRIATMTRPKEAAAKETSVVTSFKELAAMPKADGGAEWACLTEALYFEARGESFKGITAVAEVIVNRKISSRFPNTVCAVISQGVGGRPGCQFSYKCDGRPEVFREKRAYERVAKMAQLMLAGRLPPTANGALYYHTNAVRPRWSRTFRRVAQVGDHLFYHPG